ERLRLLYVAATRARDHLVVSVHRGADSTVGTAAKMLAEAGAAQAPGATPLEHLGEPAGTRRMPAARAAVAVPEFDDWARGVELARDSAARDAARVASGLEGTEPSVVLTEQAQEEDAGLHKGP